MTDESALQVRQPDDLIDPHAEVSEGHDCPYKTCPPNGWVAGIAAVRKGGLQADAAKSANTSYANFRKWLNQCTELRAEYDQTRDEYLDTIRAEALAAIRDPIGPLADILRSADEPRDRVSAGRVLIEAGEKLLAAEAKERARDAANRDRRIEKLRVTHTIEYEVAPPPDISLIEGEVEEVE